ncbi:hypothetical protein KYI11_12565 (plasmid) [Macrococcoides bohemicum]|uniref:Uncharacterized protein n=1 Tax=Macrococcoides bohemicum TaxID=1903056 RepID=A0AAJ4PAC6_9STAP|nr:hypothetical protein [Macrococcus bohemicus]QYA43652.1 hypothetical protein KYI11_12565 [Macrococcus bohemicus]
MTNVQFLVSKVYATIDDNGQERDVNKNQLVVIQDNDALVKSLVSEGNFVEIQNGLYMEYENKINALTRKYKSQVEAIEKSTDPIYSIEANGTTKKHYDIKALRSQLESEVKALVKEYFAELDLALEEARVLDAQSYTPFGSAETTKANAIVNKFEVGAYIDYADAKQSLSVALNEMNDAELTAVGTLLGRIKEVVFTNESSELYAKTFFATVVDYVGSAQPISMERALKDMKRIDIGSEYNRFMSIEQARRGFNGEVTASLNA